MALTESVPKSTPITKFLSCTIKLFMGLSFLYQIKWQGQSIRLFPNSGSEQPSSVRTMRFFKISVPIVSLDMPLFFGIIDIGNGNQNSSLFYCPKLIVHGGTKCFHGRRKVHVGINQGRDVFSPAP